MTPATEGAIAGAPRKRRASARQTSTPLVEVILSSLDAAKAEDTVSIPLEGKSSIADFMIVTTGRANRHVAAIADRLASDLKDSGYGRLHVEGLPQADWVLIDAGDVIVHIFRPEVRAFYNLEKMWAAEHPADALAG